MPLVSITSLHLRSWRFLPAFLYRSAKSLSQASRTPGNLGVRTLRSGLTFSTLTGWESVEDMRAFRNSASHARAMPKLAHWCDEAVYAHWEQPGREMPPWEAAFSRLAASPVPSRVDHPTPRHAELMRRV